MVLDPTAGEHDRFPSFPLPGTPTEDTWPGITSNEEFKAYNFTQYRAQPLINHAPRYLPQHPRGRHGGVARDVNGSWGRRCQLLDVLLAAAECSHVLEVPAAPCPLQGL